MHPKFFVPVAVVLVPLAFAAARHLPVSADASSTPSRRIQTLAAATATPPSPTLATPPARTAAAVALADARASGMIFPVAHHDAASVIGRFGDRRDGGRRSHQGIDIAAPRGTPVLAVREGLIERVERTAAGGRVVWLREARSDRLHYYAHLDEVTAVRGQTVAAGAQIGTVGTTGNAYGTRPHLHYAVYAGSDVLDPLPLLSSAAASEGTTAGGATQSRPARTKLAGAALKSSPSAGRTIAILPKHQHVEIISEAGRFYLVHSRGHKGYLAQWLVEGM